MKLTKEEALRYHRQMWTDMQKELGNYPSAADRVLFKEEWCEKHFSGERIFCHCFLCEYTGQNNIGCECCPIIWDRNDIKASCEGRDFGKGRCWRSMPISELLALPER